MANSFSTFSTRRKISGEGRLINQSNVLWNDEENHGLGGCGMGLEDR